MMACPKCGLVEAELATTKEDHKAKFRDARLWWSREVEREKARAEKAEARIRELQAELTEWHEFLSRDSYGGSLKNALERARNAEARVAELERSLDYANDCLIAKIAKAREREE